ncbi:MAG: FtsX-like permease family protein [Planctomycetes bacterium]|nr:FtsX-like permease family protein [Planctomycetota bacterium]
MLGFRVQRTLRMGLKSIGLHKLRSVLTSLGIILGVASVIVMLAIGEGLSYEVQEQLRQLGSNNIILNSVKPPEEGLVAAEHTRALKYGLTYVDAERLRSTIPNVEVVVPSRLVRRHIIRGQRRIEGNIVGTVPWFREVANRALLRGRFLTSVDLHAQAPVCVVNEPLARKLFPIEEPLGQTIRAGGDCYQVVGVLRATSAKAGSTGSDPTTGLDAYIPMTTAEGRYGDTDIRRRSGSFEATIVQLHSIIVRVPPDQDVRLTAKAIERVLRHGHAKQDYEMIVPLELLERARETKRMFNLVLGFIAAISLIVGGIGIMNIMLATVTERTREIGIRRALGARRRDIIAQFLTETTLISSTGGVLGVGLGLLAPWLVTRFAGMLTIVTPGSCVLAFSISLAVGLIFGIYPAYRAAVMDPIEALRHE